MQKIRIAEKLAEFDEHWSPRIVGELNGQHVKLVKFQGDFVWHHHADEDEMFLVLHGRSAWTIAIRRDANTRMEIDQGEFVIVPRGTEHRPSAASEVHVLLFEPAGTLNTGNVRDELTVDDPVNLIAPDEHGRTDGIHVRDSLRRGDQSCHNRLSLKRCGLLSAAREARFAKFVPTRCWPGPWPACASAQACRPPRSRTSSPAASRQAGEQGANVGRLAVLLAGFPVEVPAVTLNRMCGSSQQAIHFAAQQIAAGDAHVRDRRPASST